MDLRHVGLLTVVCWLFIANTEIPGSSASGLSKGALVGILMGAIAGAIILSATVTVLIVRRNWKYRTISKRSSCMSFSFPC